MSQAWLNIQSFFSDHELIGAINDLSIYLKLKEAGILDTGMAKRAKAARETLRRFLNRLSEIESAAQDEPLLGVDVRFQNLTDAILSARKQPDRYTSTLMHQGAAKVLPLLDDETSPNARKQLLTSLADLREVVEHHQRQDAAVIFEEQ